MASAYRNDVISLICNCVCVYIYIEILGENKQPIFTVHTHEAVTFVLLSCSGQRFGSAEQFKGAVRIKVKGRSEGERWQQRRLPLNWSSRVGAGVIQLVLEEKRIM